MGVRNLGTIGATANMAIGNTGQPVDPLVKAQLTSLANGTAAYALTSSSTDPLFNQVSLLLHCDGVNGSAVFPDSSNNNIVVTANGGAKVSTFNPEFGTGALIISTATDNITAPCTTGGALDLSTGDFTVEFWFKPVSVSTVNVEIFEIGMGGSYFSGGFLLTQAAIDSTKVNFQCLMSDASVILGSTPTGVLVANTWTAIAFCRSGNRFFLFVNGVGSALGAASALSMTWPGGTMKVGGGLFTTSISGIQYDEIRITKGTARYTSNYTPATKAFGFFIPYDPFSLYYPGRGQYWLFFGPQAFVLTMNGLNGTKSWARYTLPDTITDWTLNAGILYLRTAGNLVWQLDAGTLVDDGNAVIASAANVPFNGVMQWPYLDLGSLGRTKMLIGIDLVGEGNCSIQIAYNQADKTTFVDNPSFATSTGVTAPYFVSAADTTPGAPLPIPINAPSYSVILTFTGSSSSPNAWSWEAANIYIADSTGAGAMG